MVVVLAYAVAVFGHGAHKKMMGTIAVVHEKHLEVEATDGKTATFVLNEKTTP